MKRCIYREYGNLLITIGLALFLTYIIIVSYWLRDPITFSRPSYTNDPRTFVIRSFFPLGLTFTCGGVVIRTMYREGILFLTRADEPIHSGKPWYKGSESGLFITSCGLVVSTNEMSNATAHAGYRIVSVKCATHGDCVVKEGKDVLDSASTHRSW
ncbi:MAG: hypothetical protein OEV85_01510 [Candidatus Thorarchaeota archaeon]|nr:hypothetical protein [Candidatus Thorarchaeota archaeon]